MILPFAEKAFIDERKLLNYCLSEEHPVGKHKARVFKSALDITTENYLYLKDSIETAVLINDAIFVETSEYGDIYCVDFELVNPPKRSIVRTSWILKTEENFPRMTSCYVLIK
ncbi:hypothetical protein LV89_04114 [Arcicella aurantiaca]|uniref:DUF6883 domain-containing protein n=1 Tax=Arcicella aurantiaca TaxID=591202 RepID=A0A316DKJ0_9BACT|nr:DUF6883 domain-containing protein [Arcicella aurantiaca]PWK18415.1 hypothetical protein LV89_04114 [Arcicella aurantiaca]